jgi:hypothetical protein
VPPPDAIGLLCDVGGAAECKQSRAHGIGRDCRLENADLKVILEREFKIVGAKRNQVEKRRTDLANAGRGQLVPSRHTRKRSTNESLARIR